MKHIWKCLISAAVLIALLAALACTGDPAQPEESPALQAQPTAAFTPEPTEAIVEEVVVHTETAQPAEQLTAGPTNTPEPTYTPEPMSTPELTEAPTPEPTPVPTPAFVTIGAVGDIMIPSQIVADAKVAGGEYDFSVLFAPFAELFGSVDLMCGNLETPLAGEDGGYSQKKDEKGAFLFNAPDSVLDALKSCGVDMITTANNHCLDKGMQGLYRTVETIRAAGFYQTGTYLNAEDRQPCVIEINGIRIGFVASTRKPNANQLKRISDEEAQTAIGYLFNGENPSEAVLNDLARVREAGAEFVILFAHWDHENDGPTADDTKKIAKQLLAAGADCIIGSHPHRIKGAEYVTVQRADGPYTGLVLYSLGNFTANNRFELMVGLFAQITLQKDFETGRVTLYDAGVLPTFTIRRAGSGQQFTVLPVYADTSKISGLSSPLTASEIKNLEKARAHAFKRLGTVEGLRVLDEP